MCRKRAGAVVAELAPRGDPVLGVGVRGIGVWQRRSCSVWNGRLTAWGSGRRELAEELAARASDYAALIELGGQLREVQAEKAPLEEDWLTVAEE